MNMKQQGNIYTAEEGQWIVRLSDNKVMGVSIDLGSADSIENYTERPYTDDEYKAFCQEYGIKPLEDDRKPNKRGKR